MTFPILYEILFDNNERKLIKKIFNEPLKLIDIQNFIKSDILKNDLKKSIEKVTYFDEDFNEFIELDDDTTLDSRARIQIKLKNVSLFNILCLNF